MNNKENNTWLIMIIMLIGMILMINNIIEREHEIHSNKKIDVQYKFFMDVNK